MLSVLKAIWNTWKHIANTILEYAFRLLLLIFYFTILVPFALIFKSTDKETFKPGWQSSTVSQGDEQY